MRKFAHYRNYDGSHTFVPLDENMDKQIGAEVIEVPPPPYIPGAGYMPDKDSAQAAASIGCRLTSKSAHQLGWIGWAGWQHVDDIAVSDGPPPQPA